MTLEDLGYIELPTHARKGGFDHAAYHRVDDRLYLAHTANDAVDVIDCGPATSTLSWAWSAGATPIACLVK